ncbi:MAG: energy-coupling factor transporter transmembrane component T [Candidatus Dormibacteria bacterium]
MRGRPLALWAGSAIGLSLLSTNPVPRALIMLVALNICLAGRRPEHALRPLVLGVAMASLGAIVGNALLSHSGADVLFTIPPPLPAIGGSVTLEGLLFGGGVALGLASALFAAAPLGLALEAQELIAVLPRRLERTGTALATALTLVPALGTSFTAVRDSQRLRGWEPRGARSWLAVLTPVAVGAMERSLRVAESMEARGYASGPRTSFPRPATNRSDRLVSVGSLAALLVGVAARATGHNPDWLGYPRPAVPSLDLLAMLGPGLLILAALVLLLQWRSPTSPG